MNRNRGRCLAIAGAIAGLVGMPAGGADQGFVVHPSVGVEVDAWSFGLAGEAGLLVDKGLFMAGAHVRFGALRSQPGAPDPYGTVREYGALYGSYGVQVGGTAPWGFIQPFVLVGYERVGTVAVDNEGGPGSGRTEQNVNLELGGHFGYQKLGVLFGVRVSKAVASGSTDPAGPPPPRVAFLLTLTL